MHAWIQCLIVSIFMMLTTSLYAQTHQTTPIHIESTFARASIGKQTSGSAYLTITNKSQAEDTLVKLETPIAQKVEIHLMTTDNNIMKMREVSDLNLLPQQKITMQPGSGYHIMLMNLVKPLKEGTTFPLTLYFKRAGKLTVTVDVASHTSGMHHIHDAMEPAL